MAGVTDLALALQLNEYTRPLLAGRVNPAGIRLITSRVSLGEMFWRQLKFGEFDASEMSISSLIIATARGNRNWVVLPVFTTRWFMSSASPRATCTGPWSGPSK